jgi:hypothetical protein
MAQRLLLWEEQLRVPLGLSHPPLQALQAPQSWVELGSELNDPVANSASLDRLERIASRLLLCRQAEQAIRDGEASWQAIMARS